MTLKYVDPSERFNPGFTHDYNPRNEEIRKAGQVWDILAQKYPEQKERIDRIRRTTGHVQTLPYVPDGRDWKEKVRTLPYVPDGRDWKEKIQTLTYRY